MKNLLFFLSFPLILLSLTPSQAASPPANGWIVWSSTRQDNRHEIYLMKTDGTNLTRLTQEGGKLPLWSPDGRWIAYHHTFDDTAHVVRWDKSEDKKVCDGIPAFWMHDNSGLVCTKKLSSSGTSQDVRFDLVNPESGNKILLFNQMDFKHLQNNSFLAGGITADGRWLAGWVAGLFENGYQAENGHFTTGHASVMLDLQNKDKIYYIGPGCLVATPPKGDLIYHVSREGETMPDMFRLNIKDIMTRSSYQQELGYPDAEWGHEYMPSISNDNQWMIYAASVGCHDWYTCDYDIFLHPLGGTPQERIRVTNDTINDNFPNLFVGKLWQPGDPIVDAGIRPQIDGGAPDMAGTSPDGKAVDSRIDAGNQNLGADAGEKKTQSDGGCGGCALWAPTPRGSWLGYALFLCCIIFWPKLRSWFRTRYKK